MEMLKELAHEMTKDFAENVENLDREERQKLCFQLMFFSEIEEEFKQLKQENQRLKKQNKKCQKENRKLEDQLKEMKKFEARVQEMEQENSISATERSKLGGIIKPVKVQNSCQSAISYAKIVGLNARIKELENIHSDIKSRFTGLKQENEKLWQEKKEVEKRIQLLVEENDRLKDIQSPKLSEKEKSELEIKLSCVQEENQ
ncbi:hypothetical protein PTKIN_Ptkin13bG0157700 [Pterospermum kingtungense]